MAAPTFESRAIPSTSRMAQEPERPIVLAGRDLRDATVQAEEILHWGFVVAPVVAGIDKFTQLLTDWDQYLADDIAELSPLSRRDTMRVVGAIEVAAGVVVAFKPKIGAWVVAGWLGGIIANLLLGKRAYDVALRDFGLMLGALALGRLASRH